MIPDSDIIAAVASRPPTERRRLATILGVDDDAEFAATIARLVREEKLYRTVRPGPGKNTGFVYTVTAGGRRDISADAPEAAAPATAPPPAPTNTEKEPPMSKKVDVVGRRGRIIEHLISVPGARAVAIANDLQLEVDVVNRDLFTLKSQGKITSTGDKRPYGYQVAGKSAGPATKPPKTAPRRAKKAAPTAAVKRGRLPKRDAIIAPRPAPKPTAAGFRVAITSDDTLLMERAATKERVELQPDEILVLTGFLRRLDQASTLPR